MTESLFAFFNLGWQELMLLCLLGALLFGVRNLPEVGRNLGSTVRAFRRAVQDESEDA